MTTTRQGRFPVLPTLITLGSLFCGFGAIILATMPKTGVNQLVRIEFAAWLILAAMVFDALDGRVARMSGQTSEFGAHLDSLCDGISFGVAPAALAMSVLSEFYQRWPARLIWVACIVYLVCAILRLARFNVTTQPEDEHHRSFVGLPSPPAAGMIASFVILHVNLLHEYDFRWVAPVVLPLLLLGVGLLMVSKVRYVHLIHTLTRGERSFPFLLGLVFMIFLVAVLREFILPIIFTTYLLSGLIGFAIDRVLDRIDLAQNRDSFFR
ncbi:MAG TPA: CDP-diacylglycerol--serine O-phosphatidyltransferase [Planctomycetota bacterium]|nr:CDP-diacylglycerol--serine O-phosphatidyltransferase [Planctomycetota bacterium]